MRKKAHWKSLFVKQLFCQTSQAGWGCGLCIISFKHLQQKCFSVWTCFNFILLCGRFVYVDVINVFSLNISNNERASSTCVTSVQLHLLHSLFHLRSSFHLVSVDLHLTAKQKLALKRSEADPLPAFSVLLVELSNASVLEHVLPFSQERTWQNTKCLDDSKDTTLW